MSSRKESLKKSLGISEYPWSSDDDELTNSQIPQAFDVHILKRQERLETHNSGAGMPGSSGQQTPSSPTSPSRARVSKGERDMYWSLVGSHRIPSLDVSRGLSDAPPLSYLSRGAALHKPPTELRETRAERPSAAADLQRILAFKKLTRNLTSLRANKSNTSVYTMPSRACVHRHRLCTRGRQNSPGSAPPNGAHSSTRNNQGATSAPVAPPSNFNCNLYAMTSRGSSRNPVMTTSAISPSPDAAAAMRANRLRPSLKRLHSSRGAIPMRWHNYRTVASTSSTAPGPASRAPLPSPAAPDDAQWPDDAVVVDEPAAADNTDDVTEVTDNNDSVQPADENETTEGEPIDVDSSNTTAVSLEEEIVEIDGPDDLEVNVTGDGADDADAGEVTADVGLNEAATVPASEEAEALQQQSQESRRKRDADEAEPFTVKEFNQNLLRLLECPVCLEWMEPPMSQCRRGHLVCGRCRARLASCPVCRTTFSSVRNRAMEGVAEMVRYPCRHGCGREVRLRRRNAHEASCGARRYHCPAALCAERPPQPSDQLHHHFQSKHMSILKIGCKHKFSMKVNSEQHDTWLIAALDEYFYLRLDVDIRTWGVIVYVAYIGPKCKASDYMYEVSVLGQHNSRNLVYARAAHSDLESSSLNVSRQDCFYLTLDQALNFLRFKNRHCEPDKFLDFNVEIRKNELRAENDESDF